MEQFLKDQDKFLEDLHAFIRNHPFYKSYPKDDMQFPSPGTHHEYQIYPDNRGRGGTEIYIDKQI